MDSDDGPRDPPAVLYDANLLYPFHLRNLLVQLGVHHIVRPRWTDAIHEEWTRTLVASGKVPRERLLHTRDIMKRVLPEADVQDYAHRMVGFTLPDPDDGHVVAAALEGRAGTILTFNLRHFPAEILAPLGLVALDPDEYLCQLHGVDPEAIAAVIEAARVNLSRTAPDPTAFLDALERQRLPAFAARLRASAT